MRANSSGSRVGDPRVLLRLRAREPVVRRIVHQRHGRGERARALADRLAQRPQPRGVDVGVAGRHDPVGTGPRRHGEHAGDLRPGRHRGLVAPAARRRQHVERPDDRHADAGPAGVVERQRPHHTVQYVEVQQQGLRVGVDAHQLGPLQPVQRLVTRRRRRAERRRAERWEQRVRRRLDGQLDRARLARQGQRLAARVDPLHRPTLRVANQPLALEPRRVGREPEVEERLEPADRTMPSGTSPVRRNHVVPHGGPQRPPTANGASASRLGPASTRERPPLRVHEREHALGQLAVDPLLEQLAVVVHRAIVTSPSIASTGARSSEPWPLRALRFRA